MIAETVIWELRLAADDLAGLDAGRADVEPLLVAAGAGHDVHRLDVRVPPTAGAAVGVRHRLTEAGAFPADIAHSGHGSSSSKSRGSGKLAGAARVDPDPPEDTDCAGIRQNDPHRCRPRWLGSMGRIGPPAGGGYRQAARGSPSDACAPP